MPVGISGVWCRGAQNAECRYAIDDLHCGSWALPVSVVSVYV